MKKLKYTILLVCLVLSASLTYAQTKLNIGDEAPALKYSKWIKGTPVTEYKKNHLYVFEFWATWCGPCKAAMPHLSELANKYKDQATFTGVNIWEKTGDKPYESSLSSVTDFVNSVGAKMAYNVVADNNEQYMANKWMIAAGQRGIPATFLVNEGKIIWIGHPMNLDSIMTLSINGKYDMEAFKQKFNASTARMDAVMAKFKLLDPMLKAIKEKEYDRALAIIDTLDTSDPMIDMQVKAAKLQVLFAQKNEIDALKFSENIIKENKNFGALVSNFILNTDGLSKRSYLYAVELNNILLEQDGVVKPLIYHSLAQAYSKAGDFKSAISSEQKAISGAQDALKKGEFIGSILDNTVTEFEASLAKYIKAQ